MIYKDVHNLSRYIGDNLDRSVDMIFNAYGLQVSKRHVKRVAGYIVETARLLDINEEKAKVAALLHDIGGIVPCKERIDYCELHGIKLCEEERELPLIIHQKISKHIAHTQFKIKHSVSVMLSHT
ncbi:MULTISPECIES: HD domain-containing protein [unclassified Fusibacter]|uniref:HD domain-containing protein n=1 Tax=unclassified Fusibacter TaxID=2624464 RepID=UPI0010133BAD|nr:MULTISPECIES: HD domain-containing protein [unclassified Fusibacter]MCK8061138.1 HD domain-containing protein [Fusibacter sp. A2]NPE23326.1 HD domain-containing protein [Fusibacter sp. A1]RXV59368.1 HD domain-containing protein [Fusibacter sp. A1]